MRNLFLGLVVIANLTGCHFFAKKQMPIIPYQIQKKSLDLSAYKNINITANQDQICMSYDDYSKELELLNTLKNYIEYQDTVIVEIDHYYNKSLNK